MAWGYIGGAAIGVAGSFLSDSGSEGESTPQVPAWLKDKQIDLANRTAQLMDRQSLSPEQRVAELNPDQQRGINQLTGFGEEGGTGATLLDRLLAGSEGVEGGMGGLAGILGGEGPQNEGVDMNYVNSLINNDVLGDQIQASTRDVERRFSEVDAPQSRLMQALSGGTGSTRGAIGDAILQRGAEDRAGDISASMRGNAFSQALNIGSRQAEQNANLGGQTRGQNIDASGQMLRGGLDSTQLGNAVGINNIDMLLQGGGMNQAYEQALNDIEYENWARMYGDIEQASNIFGDLGSQYTGVSTRASSSVNPVTGGLAGASAFGGGLNDLFGSWGSDDGGSDPFNFDDGGFYNPNFDDNGG